MRQTLELQSRMGTMRKTITVTVQQDQWIKAQIAAGDFTNDSESFREEMVAQHVGSTS